MGTGTQLAPIADVEHLRMLQAVISRLAQNSFQAKSWSVAIVTAILVLNSRLAQENTCALALFPAVCFWMLDAYYLREERLFRAVYKASIEGQIPPFSMDKGRFDSLVPTWFRTMFAPSVFLVHLIILFVVTAVLTFTQL
jgi:hypothetical protein